jgi:Uma2 family endonuclease
MRFRAAIRKASPPPKDWDDLLDEPEGMIGEIVDGMVTMSPRPGHPHTKAATLLTALLTNAFSFGIGGPGGWVILFEPRIRFGRRNIRVPDVAGWRRERFQAPEGNGPYTVVPDWICEVRSARTALIDSTEKLPLYAEHGVRHAWMVDPIGQTLQALRLEEHKWVIMQSSGGEMKVRAEPFDAVELDLAPLWEGREPPDE